MFVVILPYNGHYYDLDSNKFGPFQRAGRRAMFGNFMFKEEVVIAPLA